MMLNGKKRNLKRKDFVDYFGGSVLGLNEGTRGEVLSRLAGCREDWRGLIAASFLSEKLKADYSGLLDERAKTLGL